MKSATIRFCLSALAAMCFAISASAQMPAYTKAGPIPPALISAKSVFVSNAGSTALLFGGSGYPKLYAGDPNRAYTEFCAALKATGDFTLVSDPTEADLDLELRVDAYGSSESSGSEVRLVIYDRKSHYVLWTVSSDIGFAARKGGADKNFDAALTDVLNQFLEVTGKAPAASH